MSRVALAQVRQTTFDPSQAIAQLAASRQQARVAKRSGTNGQMNTGRNLNYTSRPLNEESLYVQAAPAEERSVKEMQNRAAWNADRQQQLRQQQNLALPPEASEILESAPDVAQDPEVRDLVGDYKAQIGGLAQQAFDSAVGDPVRRAIDRQKQKVKDELVKKIKNSKIFQEGKKKVSEWIWRIIGPIGSTAESEGALAWTEFTFGATVNLFQTVKTIILPNVTDGRPGDPDNGKILKGVLAFAEPDSLDPKDPAMWLTDAPYSAIWFFLINYVHLMILALLTLIGSVILIVTMGPTALGEIGASVASMLGII